MHRQGASRLCILQQHRRIELTDNHQLTADDNRCTT